MDGIKTIVAGILLALIGIFCINAFSPISDGEVMNATFISKNDRKVKLEITKKTDEVTQQYRNSDGEIISEWKEESLPIAYLHVGKNEYKGTYQKSSKGFKTYIIFYISDENAEIHEASSEYDTLVWIKYKKEGNKLKLVDGWGDKSIFEDNKTFYKKTWWNTWG